MEEQPHSSLTTRTRVAWYSSDHRAVARLYFFLALIAVLTGQLLSLLMRFHLVNPQAKVGWFESLWPNGAPSGVMTPELYLSILTLHGTLMVFFVLTTAPMGTFANLVLPEQLGTTRMAYPRLNALSFWIIALAFLVLIASFVGPGGGPLSGWTAYPPLSAIGAISGPGEGLGQTLWIVSIAIFCLGSLLSSINIVEDVNIAVFELFGHAPILAVFLELMKMAVRPAHDHLQDIMETTQRGGTGDLDQSPDRRPNLLQGNPEFVNMGLSFHLAVISSGVRQVPGTQGPV